MQAAVVELSQGWQQTCWLLPISPCQHMEGTCQSTLPCSLLCTALTVDSDRTVSDPFLSVMVNQEVDSP